MKKEKKTFIYPEAEIIEFSSTDIIVTSDPYGAGGDTDEINGPDIQ